MNYLKKILFVISVLFTVVSCTDSNVVDVSNIEVNSKLVRFDSLFYNADEVSLATLKANYPLMFPEEYSDSVWVNKINDSEEQKIYKKTVDVFGTFDKEYFEIVEVFKHIRYYFPRFNTPDVYTIISDFDYQYPVLFSGERLFVSLDMYLGAGEEEYSGFPEYLVRNMRPERIKVDVSDALLRTVMSKSPYDKTLLSQMVYSGKLLYLTQKMLPGEDASLVIGYSPEELKWCETNEAEIWTYLIKNKYIYNTDPRLTKRFIDVAPFTKFFLDMDRESPGRVGIWIGWQIVNSYMENNDVSIDDLVKNNDAREIFVKSKYKPRK
ncbi:MAG: gliding motility lipoprotein GldB [Bacteroidota bacterium]